MTKSNLQIDLSHYSSLTPRHLSRSSSDTIHRHIIRSQSLDFLKSEKEPITCRATGIAIHLLDPVIIDDVSREISIDSRSDQLHLYRYVLDANF
jgi:hypothetical protein